MQVAPCNGFGFRDDTTVACVHLKLESMLALVQRISDGMAAIAPISAVNGFYVDLD
jgi:hypothetical protein